MITIAILAVLAVTAFVGLNPAGRVRDANNAQRRNNVMDIAYAVELYSVENDGATPTAQGSVLPSVTQANLVNTGVSAEYLDDVIGNQLKEIPVLPENTTYYVGINGAGLFLVGTGLENQDGSTTLFTNLGGDTGISVGVQNSSSSTSTSSATSSATSTYIPPSSSATTTSSSSSSASPYEPIEYAFVDIDCNVIETITNGATYTVGDTYPDAGQLNIKLIFSDESIVKKVRTRYRQINGSGSQVYTEQSNDNDGDGGYFVTSDDCSHPHYTANEVTQLQEAGYRHDFEIQVYGERGIVEDEYYLSYTLVE